MRLEFSKIKDITLGAVRIEQNENGISFYRFTKKQEEMYKNRSEDFYRKTFATSGIRFRFRTNSTTLFLNAVIINKGSSRSYFSFDVFVNGERIDSIDNFSGANLPPEYNTLSFPTGEFSKEFYLGTGEKEVCVYLPWSVSVVLKEIAVDDGAFIDPIKPGKKMLCFGDSITQGYDALRPSNKYVSKLADVLDSEEYNKAIGGEIFYPDLAAAKEDFCPDYITVAYGTNDWNRCESDVFANNCKEFFNNLSVNYPNAKIFAITPIWRKDMDLNKPFGEFKGVGEIIKSQVAKHQNIWVIDGFCFVPQNEKLYADLRLHPNDKGFEFYFEGLVKAIKSISNDYK